MKKRRTSVLGVLIFFSLVQLFNYKDSERGCWVATSSNTVVYVILLVYVFFNSLVEYRKNSYYLVRIRSKKNQFLSNINRNFFISYTIAILYFFCTVFISKIVNEVNNEVVLYAFDECVRNFLVCYLMGNIEILLTTSKYFFVQKNANLISWLIAFIELVLISKISALTNFNLYFCFGYYFEENLYKTITILLGENIVFIIISYIRFKRKECFV